VALHARQFCAGFFYEYNYVHHHSGIAWHTPASVHFGTAETIDEARQTGSSNLTGQSWLSTLAQRA